MQMERAGAVNKPVKMLLRYLDRIWQPPSRSFRKLHPLLKGRYGIEIGGPSRVFSRRSLFPVYPIAGNLDNCNFGSDTIWEGNIHPGNTFRFDSRKPAGHQFIAEATKMDFLPSGKYDFVLSSHVLEHIANPVLALMQWNRILKNQGFLVMVVPNGSKTFDHKRPVTTLTHLVEDYKNKTKETDLTHLPEILALHDLSQDLGAGNMGAFKLRSLENFHNRCLHHHVFNAALAVEVAEYTGFEVLSTDELRPHHILLIARKTG